MSYEKPQAWGSNLEKVYKKEFFIQKIYTNTDNKTLRKHTKYRAYCKDSIQEEEITRVAMSLVKKCQRTLEDGLGYYFRFAPYARRDNKGWYILTTLMHDMQESDIISTIERLSFYEKKEKKNCKQNDQNKTSTTRMSDIPPVSNTSIIPTNKPQNLQTSSLPSFQDGFGFISESPPQPEKNYFHGGSNFKNFANFFKVQGHLSYPPDHIFPKPDNEISESVPILHPN